MLSAILVVKLPRANERQNTGLRTMPQTCVVVNCRNRSSKESSTKFFRFPADKEQTERWIAAVKRKNWCPTEYSRVCSDHFVIGKSERFINAICLTAILKLESSTELVVTIM